MECPRCKNTEFTKDGLCKYCIWKGDAGPGLLLKTLIKKDKKEKAYVERPKQNPVK